MSRVLNWFHIGKYKALAGFAGAVTVQGGLALGGRGIALLSRKALGDLDYTTAMVGGYLTALIPIVLWFRSPFNLALKFVLWDWLIGVRVFTYQEVQDMKNKAKRDYRKQEGVEDD
jgi:hypothetical protein